MPQVFVQGFAEPPKTKTETVLGGLADVMGVLNERKARNERELQEQMMLLYKYPQFADTMGNEIKSKWGKKRPDIASTIDAMQNANKIERESEMSSQAWAKMVADEEASRYAMRNQVGQISDVIPTSTPGFGAMGLPQMMPMPNPAKVEAQKAIDNLDDPAYEALMKLDPKQREQVIAKHMREGKSIPHSIKGPIDPSKVDEATRTAMRLGIPLDKIREAYEIRQGLKPAPAEIIREAQADEDWLRDNESKITAANTWFSRAQQLERENTANQIKLENLRFSHRADGDGEGGGGGGGIGSFFKSNEKAADDYLSYFQGDQKYYDGKAEAIAQFDKQINSEHSTPEGKMEAVKAKEEALKGYAKIEAGFIPAHDAARFKRFSAEFLTLADKNGIATVNLFGQEITPGEAIERIIKGYTIRRQEGVSNADAMKQALMAFDAARSGLTPRLPSPSMVSGHAKPAGPLEPPMLKSSHPPAQWGPPTNR